MEDNSKVDLSKYIELRGDNVVLSKFCGLHPSKRAKLANKSANARARGENSAIGSFTLLNENNKMQIRNRTPKYAEMYKEITEFILIG